RRRGERGTEREREREREREKKERHLVGHRERIREKNRKKKRVRKTDKQTCRHADRCGWTGSGQEVLLRPDTTTRHHCGPTLGKHCVCWFSFPERQKDK